MLCCQVGRYLSLSTLKLTQFTAPVASPYIHLVILSLGATLFWHQVVCREFFLIRKCNLLFLLYLSPKPVFIFILIFLRKTYACCYTICVQDFFMQSLQSVGLYTESLQQLLEVLSKEQYLICLSPSVFGIIFLLIILISPIKCIDKFFFVAIVNDMHNL